MWEAKGFGLSTGFVYVCLHIFHTWPVVLNKGVSESGRCGDMYTCSGFLGGLGSSGFKTVMFFGICASQDSLGDATF